MTADQKVPDQAFSTRVYPALSALLPITLVAPSFALVVLPFMSDVVAIGIGLFSALVIFAIVLLSAPVVSLSNGDAPLLRVGRATIERRFVEKAEIISGEELKFEKGPGLNAKAYFVNQAGKKQFVKVTLNDPNDPTPYWLFACNKPEELVVALRANR